MKDDVQHVAMRALCAAWICALLLALAPAPDARAAGRPYRDLLTNSGFELMKGNAPYQWELTGKSASVSRERVASGRQALKINDVDPKAGSGASSKHFLVLPGRGYLVRARVFLASGSVDGLRIGIRFRDSETFEIPDDNGNPREFGIRPLPGEWTTVSRFFPAPARARTVSIDLVSGIADTGICFVDDFRLVECRMDELGNSHRWEGATPDPDQTMDAGFSARWSHGFSSIVQRNFIPPEDWSNYSGITFWLHSDRASDRNIVLLVVSENPNTIGTDCLTRRIAVDWEGWRQFAFSFSEMDVIREPVGMNRIDSVQFVAGGWGNTPDPKAVMRIEGLKPVHLSN